MFTQEIDDNKYYNIPQVAKLLWVTPATARYKILGKIPKSKKYMVDMNRGWKIRVIRVSWFSIKKFILWL